MSATDLVTLVTFAEFETLPDAPGKRELLDGCLIEITPATYRHAQLSRAFYRLLDRNSEVGEQAYFEAGYRIAGGWVQPDVSVIWPGQRKADGYLTGAPRLAIEILSPSSTAGQIERKLTLYFAEGAAEVWVVDPDKGTMTVYQRSGQDVKRIAVAERYEALEFGVSVILAQVFVD